MNKTTISLHTKFQIGSVDPRIFGGFLEHMGRAVYQGVYDPDNSTAGPDGLRSDVLGALRRLDMTTMRYPGGNFASGYHWENGVGSRADRPTMRELAWQSIETNQFGTDEFIHLCRVMGWSPMITVNLGTGTPEEARNWVEYCNSPPGTHFADKRVANGHSEPHGVGMWCLGNEMDGPWQLGHVPVEHYAVRAQQSAKMMKGVDPSIEFITCGSSGTGMSTYIQWDQKVLEYIGDLADYISLHSYVGNLTDDTPDYLAVTNAIDKQIEEVDAVCRFVQAQRRSSKRAYLCFDEWNVWYKNKLVDGEGKFAPHLIEEVYNLEDALVVAGFLNSFIRHADVLKVANLAQIVNVIAPILTKGDKMLIQSIFYPFEMFSKRRKGISLQSVVDGPMYTGQIHGDVLTIDSSAILNEDKLKVFITNRSLDQAADVYITVADCPIDTLESGELLTGHDAKATNTFEQPDLIRALPIKEAGGDVRIKDGEAAVEIPPLSVMAMTFHIRR
jgi:alpha-N-arabinofuranosidase